MLDFLARNFSACYQVGTGLGVVCHHHHPLSRFHSTASTHGGALGGALAFVMWSLPGYIVMTLSGKYLYTFVDPSDPPLWLLGVPPAAMSLIFKASYGKCMMC